MKRILFIAFLLLIANSGVFAGQVGHLIKAKISYDLGHYEEALYLLNKAESDDYGNCGFTHLIAMDDILQLRAKSYMAMESYGEARAALNEGCGSFVQDSLRVLAFQKQYGPKKVARNLDLALKNITFLKADCPFASIPIVGERDPFLFPISLLVSRDPFPNRTDPAAESGRKQAFCILFRRLPIYSQLKRGNF